ncbi:MAG: hypothetical protein JRG92_08225 [Deltaproteobacteria bacterium]|nr:hypothetical protein [Deltaproteobacteria bacterium]MBW2698354.1 hypothetical protein [Deltaproteobacteria bacterium]
MEAEPPPSLADIPTLPLSPANQEILDSLAEDMLGTAAWRRRKLAEARGLIALSQIAPRLVIRALDLRTDLLAMVDLLDTPVACLTPGANEIHRAHGAQLAIVYPEEILVKPIAGTRSIRVLAPKYPYHSNIGPYPEPVPALCLGASVPRGFPVREMVLSCYAALTLQAVSLDNLDPAGVLNADASRYWQRNAASIPLTTEPFLGTRGPGPPQSMAGEAGAQNAAEGRS